MIKEKILPQRGTLLRKNRSIELEISLNQDDINSIFVINGSLFISEHVSKSDLTIRPNDYYMIINKGIKAIEIEYSQDNANHEIIYDPYKFENSEKIDFKPETFKKKYNVPSGYIDTLAKWYSFKFTYPNYNLIFVRPEMGLSIQTHKLRNEFWEILEGKPIIINDNKVHYFVDNGEKFEIPIDTYHTVINTNLDKFVILREQWGGTFDEDDIIRVFNPNKYK